MNETLEQYARSWIKENLALCTEAQQLLFRRMYSPLDTTKNINLVVDDMDADELDHAMSQIKRTLEKKETSNEASC